MDNKKIKNIKYTLFNRVMEYLGFFSGRPGMYYVT